MDPFLSHLHEDLRRTRLTMRGSPHIPHDIGRGLHKTYERMEKIPLPEPQKLLMTIDEALVARRSSTTMVEGALLTLEELGTLFGHACGRHAPDGTRRHYPSGGGLYPIETYLIATRLEHAGEGIFHYNPTLHALERLWELPRNFDIKNIAQKPPTLRPSAMIVFTSVWRRSSIKYGDLAYLHALLEAGHMSENVLLIAAALDLQVRPYAGFNDQRIIELLDLNEEAEQPVHSIVLSKLPGGRADDTASESNAFDAE